MALECSSSQANPPEALSRRLELVDPGADLELHVHRDDVLQEGVDIIIWERGAPLAAQVLPLIKAIVKLADIANPVEAEEPLLARGTQLLISALAVDAVPAQELEAIAHLSSPLSVEIAGSVEVQ